MTEQKQRRMYVMAVAACSGGTPYRSGHYDRDLTTTSGDVMLYVPRFMGIPFETAIILPESANKFAHNS